MYSHPASKTVLTIRYCYCHASSFSHFPQSLFSQYLFSYTNKVLCTICGTRCSQSVDKIIIINKSLIIEIKKIIAEHSAVILHILFHNHELTHARTTT